ncbi:MAG: decarboxylase [Deltaproteobacteria bacterium]|nr:MAG: decarboxylase [Deltaproteobacteria bacterium]
MNNSKVVLHKAAEILQNVSPVLEDEVICAYVRSFQRQRQLFLDFAARHDTPVYLFDEDVLLQRAEQFTTAFSQEIPGIRAFFAMKSNNHPAVAKSLVEFGLGLDVSSGLELETAIATGCQNIIFSGPGKTEAELDLAVANAAVVTVLIDSFGELDRLERVSRSLNAVVRAGVRLTTEEKGLWRKFGVPLAELESFMTRAENFEHLRVCGLQFHTSWNLTPSSQVSFLIRLGKQLATMKRQRAKNIEFLDIGGGYWPSRGEWLHFSATPQGRITHLVLPDIRQTERYRYPAEPLEVFAREIGKTLRQNIFPYVDCKIFTEPGRWLVNDAMHILLTVVDKKGEDLVIVDGGTNIVGWERFETDYFPVINLSNPSFTERKCFIFGSLCTPHDVWGYSYFGDGIEPGDILMVPSQGAYTYSLRQSFIKPLAPMFPLQT